MKIKHVVVFMAIFTVSLLSACGGGGGGGEAADPNALANVSLSYSKPIAQASGSDAITITARVTTAGGSAATDGTVVTFAAPGSAAVLSPTSASTVGGNASVTVTHPAFSDVNNKTIVITAATGSLSNNVAVKFIKQPSSVDVSIGFGVAINNLATLKFKLISSNTATFNNASPQSISAINAASGSTVTGNFVPGSPTGSNAITLTNTSGGFAVTALSPIIKATYTVGAGTVLPTFSVDQADAGFQAFDSIGNFTLPQQVGAGNMVVITQFDTEL